MVDGPPVDNGRNVPKAASVLWVTLATRSRTTNRRLMTVRDSASGCGLATRPGHGGYNTSVDESRRGAGLGCANRIAEAALTLAGSASRRLCFYEEAMFLTLVRAASLSLVFTILPISEAFAHCFVGA